MRATQLCMIGKRNSLQGAFSWCTSAIRNFFVIIYVCMYVRMYLDVLCMLCISISRLEHCIIVPQRVVVLHIHVSIQERERERYVLRRR